MQISSKFSVAVHILSLLATWDGGDILTSEKIAGSVQTHPVVIRRILSLLKKAKLVKVYPAASKQPEILKPFNEITLLEIYRAVEMTGDTPLFHLHENPNPNCMVGKNIQRALNGTITQAQQALENILAQSTLESVIKNLKQ